jgi:hypothetical protein
MTRVNGSVEGEGGGDQTWKKNRNGTKTKFLSNRRLIKKSDPTRGNELGFQSFQRAALGVRSQENGEERVISKTPGCCLLVSSKPLSPVPEFIQ